MMNNQLEREFQSAMIRMMSLCADIARKVGDDRKAQAYRQQAYNHAQEFQQACASDVVTVR